MTNKSSGKKQSVVAPKKKIEKLSKNKRQVYHIIWRDAFSEADEWHDESSLDCSDYICETIGFLIEDNKKPNYYTIASTVTNDNVFCCVMNIPKAMVIKKTLLNFKSI